MVMEPPTAKRQLFEFTSSTGTTMPMQNWPPTSLRVFIILLALRLVSAIGTKYTIRAMNGYYCASDYINNYTAIEHQRCVAHCITNRHCWVLTYSSRGKYCLLGTQPCAKAVTDDDFRMMTFRGGENIHCIQWVWSDGSSYPNRTVEQFHSLHQALARIPIEGEIFIGRSVPGQSKIFITRNGAGEIHSDYYPLVVSDYCSVAWVPYMAGNPLPRGAVEGGYLNLLVPRTAWESGTGHVRKGKHTSMAITPLWVG